MKDSIAFYTKEFSYASSRSELETMYEISLTNIDLAYTNAYDAINSSGLSDADSKEYLKGLDKALSDAKAKIEEAYNENLNKF